MDPLEHVVAGLSCRQVLGHLGDYLDGDLGADTLAQVKAHLAGCRTCEAFGGRVAALVTALRSAPGVWGDPPTGARERVLHRLRGRTGS